MVPPGDMIHGTELISCTSGPVSPWGQPRAPPLPYFVKRRAAPPPNVYPTLEYSTEDVVLFWETLFVVLSIIWLSFVVIDVSHYMMAEKAQLFCDRYGVELITSPSDPAYTKASLAKCVALTPVFAIAHRKTPSSRALLSYSHIPRPRNSTC